MQTFSNKSVLGGEDSGFAMDMIGKSHVLVDPPNLVFPTEPALPETPPIAAAEARTLQPAQVCSMAAVAFARLLTVDINAKLADVASQMSRAQLSLAVVCDLSGSVAGVITDTLLVHQFGLGNVNIFIARAGDVMTREFTVCHQNDSLPQVLAAMHKFGLVHVPILDNDNRPQGVVYARDGLRALLAAGNYEEAQLRDYVMGGGYK